jgi:hypothetical protein
LLQPRPSCVRNYERAVLRAYRNRLDVTLSLEKALGGSETGRAGFEPHATRNVRVSQHDDLPQCDDGLIAALGSVSDRSP